MAQNATVAAWAEEVPVATLGIGDILDGLDVIPGFTYPLAKLFAQ